MKRFAYIDALRGYAVLGVVVAHVGQQAGLNIPPAFARGVQLFFVVSAFTLLTSWRERNDGAMPFFVRRLFRIVPMFWLSIPLYISPTEPILRAIGSAFFLQATRPDWLFAAIIPGAWSICAEIGFYCLFPLIAALITSLPRAILFVAASVMLSRLWRTAGFDAMAAFFPDASQADLGNFANYTLPAQLPVFAAGIAGYFVVPHLAKLPRYAHEIVLATALCAAIWYALLHPFDFAAFGGLFAMAAACMTVGAGGYLTNRIVQHIGVCSFSIYLLHWKITATVAPLVKLLPFPTGFFTLFVVALIATVAASTVAYHVIERPMIRLGNRLARFLDQSNDANDVVAYDRGRHVDDRLLSNAAVDR